MKDKEFLDRLVLLSKKYGWSGDYVEVYQFVEWIHKELDTECPDLNPDDEL